MIRLIPILICLMWPLAATAGDVRVAPRDGQLTQALVDGHARSATLRRLLDSIGTSRAIVYVRRGFSRDPWCSGFTTWLSRSGDWRFLLIVVSPRLSGDRLIALLAHELQHAVEIAEDPAIVDARSLADYYELHGIDRGTASGTRAFDSHDAQVAGRTVLRELRHDLVAPRLP
jgi:hypothetical protein